MRIPTRWPFILILFSFALPAPDAFSAEPLHERIDNLVAAKTGGPTSDLAGDAEFLRRVYLDLAGRIPTVVEARAFLDEESGQKRKALIDRLLGGPDYPQRMQELFNVMFMERRGDHEAWTEYLRSSFAENKPWDQMAREILSPDVDDKSPRGSSYFLTKRLEKYGQNPTDHPGLVRDMGRLMLGMDIQCAQCHEHPFIGDYEQDVFQGMFAFLGHTFIRRDTDYPAIGENPLKKKIEFVSVFDTDIQTIGPRIPGGQEIEVPTFKQGEEYIKPPDKKAKFPGILKFSTLTLLAEQLPSVDNPAFARNMANRLWFVMMGRGLVHPLDLHHSDNPPSHPELLDLLSDEFVKNKFDINWLLRELALTETYQRSGLLPDAEESVLKTSCRSALEKRLSAEQLLTSMLIATGEFDRVKALSEAKPESGDQPEKVADEEESGPLTLDQLRERFVKALANPPREPEVEYSPSVRGALFVMNDDEVLSWLTPRDGNLVDHLAKISEPDKIAEELYLGVLTRVPTEEETAEVTDYLAKHDDRREVALGHLAWALLASTEFSTNH